MKIKEITKLLEALAPLSYQESYDNCGLLVGDLQQEVSGILITLDTTEEVVEEAVRMNCNLIISHHPLIFSGLKKVTGRNYIERTVIKAIKSDVAIYAIHTNLDNVSEGVNKKIAEKIGLENLSVLSPKKDLLKKLVTFCPDKHSEQVRSALFKAGAGVIGKYDECSFNLNGWGTFRAGEETNPFVGKRGERHNEKEERIETIFPADKESFIIRALIQSHPYEEAAYDIYSLENEHPAVGSGMLGELPEEVDVIEFLKEIKQVFKAGSLRYTLPIKNTVKKIAVCGGSGSFLLKEAINKGADLLLTADFKYHQFFDADNQIVIADIGHFESEQFTKELIYEHLIKKNFTFAVRLSEVKTNPINYL